MLRYMVAMLVAIAMYIIPARAQDSCTLSAKIFVLETHNNSPVPDVEAHIDELGITMLTDESGSFLMKDICAGKYTIHLQGTGLEPVAHELDIVQAGTYRVRISHSPYMLQQVIIKEERARTIQQSKAELSRSDITAAGGKSLADMLQSVNGVTMLSNGATISKPVIHGLHSNRVMVLNNGIRQEDQQWGGEHAPGIDPFLANNITVIKGAAGVRYGTDAIAGVILAEPAPIRKTPGTDAELNLAAFSNNRMGVASAMVQHTFRKIPSLGIRLQGTWKKAGNYRVPGGYWVANTGVQEQDFSATATWRKVHYGMEVFYSRFNTDLGIYTGSHTGSQQDLVNAINSPVPLVPASFSYDIQRPRQHVVHDLVKAKLYADNKLGTWNLVYAYQHNFRQEYDIMRIDNGQAQLNLTLNTQTLNLNLDHKPMGHFSGSAGIDAMYQDNFFRNKDRVFIPSYTSVGIAGYAIERYKKKNLLLEAGLRYDYKYYDMFNPEGPQLKNVEYEFDYKNASATLGMHYTLSQGWEWAMTIANAWRAPQANELFSAGLHQGAARIELGNKNLEPERAYSLNTELKYRQGDKLSAEISLYAQSIHEYIYLKPGGEILTIRGYYKLFNYTQTDALLSGTDISVSYAWNQYFKSGARLSLLRAWDQSAKDWLIAMPSDRASFNLKYERNLSRQFQECFIGLSGRYVARQQRIPSNFDDIDYPRPPADYYTLDAETGTKLQWGRQPVYCSITVANLLNRKYREYMDVFRYFVDQPGTNVALRIRVPFNF